MKSVVFAVLLLLTVAVSADAQLVVHEWGTFTCLQNEAGKELGSINQDTEPLPSFVERLMVGGTGGKGLPILPTITMRLETPVVYFHLPPGSEPLKLNFKATFKGGLLSEFYPKATTTGDPNALISSSTVGSLEWKEVLVGKPAVGPATDSPVWLAPRKVDAADVTAAGQSERYLFYRGVGHLASPVSVVRKGAQLQLFNRSLADSYVSSNLLHIKQAWYLDARTDGTSAFRKIKLDQPASPLQPIASISADFAKTEYQPNAIEKLREEMKQALVADGLFDDEAEAMLNTWNESYFKSAGTRVLFLVPRPWTDYYLPIEISTPAKVQRVMVGRVDLITPRHREIVAELIKSVPPGTAIPTSPELGRFAAVIMQDSLPAQRAKPQTPAQ